MATFSVFQDLPAHPVHGQARPNRSSQDMRAWTRNAQVHTHMKREVFPMDSPYRKEYPRSPRQNSAQDTNTGVQPWEVRPKEPYAPHLLHVAPQPYSYSVCTPHESPADRTEAAPIADHNSRSRIHGQNQQKRSRRLHHGAMHDSSHSSTTCHR